MLKFLKKILTRKKILIPVLILGLFLSFLPTQPADAIIEAIKKIEECGSGLTSIGCWLKNLINIVVMFPVLIAAGAPIMIIVIIGIVGILISFVAYAFSILLLNWVVSPEFINMPLTQIRNASGVHNNIIDVGWHATSNLVNLVFILILVFIAFATILKLESYGLKKLLPKFIIVVLLVNFSLVIMGVIVDIANIIQMSFLGSVGDLGTQFINIFWKSTPIGELVMGLVHATAPWDFIMAFDTVAESFLTLSGFIGMIGQMFAAIFFGFFGGFVIMLYVMLFAIRNIVMWFLAILAPIAWACSILPATQKYWKMWWKYFLQWAFVGAIAGFFLWLSGQVITSLDLGLTEGKLASGSLGSDATSTSIVSALISPLTTVITGAFSFAAVIIFMIIGFVISVKASGGGTEVIMKAAQRGGKAAGLVLAKRGWAGTKQYAKDSMENRRLMQKDYKNFRASGDNWLKARTKSAFGYAKRDDIVKIATTVPKDSIKRGRKTYNNFRSRGYDRREAFGLAFRGAYGAALKNKAANGIWGAVKDASKSGWKAAIKTKKEKQKKTRKDAAGNEITELFCPDCGAGPLTPDTSVCPNCKAIIS